MKILGFYFGEKPTVMYHINNVVDKFKKRVWMITHLKKASIDNNVLLDVYLSMLRPILEYCSPVYHSMITEEMSNLLENMQKLALRIIFGFDKDYTTILAEKNIISLKDRRQLAFENFAVKLSSSSRFKHWFPLNEAEVNMRGRKKYQEVYARTKRLYESPLFAMRRFMNSQEILEIDED